MGEEGATGKVVGLRNPPISPRSPSVGSTGHWPVPNGDPPLGTGRVQEFLGSLFGEPTSFPLRPASGRTAQAGRLFLPIPVLECELITPAVGISNKRIDFGRLGGNLLADVPRITNLISL